MYGWNAFTHGSIKLSVSDKEPLNQVNPHYLCAEGEPNSSFCNKAYETDYYGRVSASWNGGGLATNRLKTYLDPDNTDYVLSLADACIADGNYTKAERSLVSAIKDNPSVDLYTKLSSVSVLTGTVSTPSIGSVHAASA